MDRANYRSKEVKNPASQKYPTLSVIIATYNAEQTISDTLKSCLCQSFWDIEIVVVDDCSSDDTRQILQWQAAQDHRIRLIRNQKNLWPYRSLNVALDHAQWQYISIQDHDDLWHPQKLEKQVHFLEHHKKYVGCGTTTLMWYEWDGKWFEYFVWKESYYTIHPSLVFRNQWQRYPTDQWTYMLDAVFQKTVLCKWEKVIYNINETLTLHLVKDGARNFSYKWFSYSRMTIRTIFTLHPVRYGICILWFETCRKIWYPVLRLIGKGKWIDTIERVPFVILGRKIEVYNEKRRSGMGFG